MYGRCWTSNKESDAMWRIYSYQRQSILITTTKDRLTRVLDGYMDNTINYYIGSVSYDLEQKNVLDDAMSFLDDERQAYSPYMHKRSAYSHEEEVRAIIYCDAVGNITEIRAGLIVNDIKEKNLSDDDNIEEICRGVITVRPDLNDGRMPREILCTIDSVEKYIDSVVVNPFAEDWFCRLVGDICNCYNLEFSGKSKLYDVIKN